MSNAIFPSTSTLPGQTWNITRTPRFATKSQQSVGGSVLVAAFRPYPIWRWTLEYEFLRQNSTVEWQTLVNFVLARQGAFDTFLYDDPQDDNVANCQFAVGDGATTAFQLTRTVLAAGFSEPVYNIKASPTPIIYDNGSVLTPVTDYTIGATGVVTFVVPPVAAHLLTWTGGYYWRCRFDLDEQEFAMFAQTFWKVKQLSFVSVLGA